MRRILVVDDERPVIEGISLMVKRDLAGEFEIAGHAMSGRDAIEKAASLAPDLILMDVKMPGISGLDAIREIRKRGSAAAFILVTAYERFDIAREAVELGVIDYLLKPIVKDQLALALRHAAESIDQRSESDRKEIEHREHEETMRIFVESAFLHGVMLGERFGAELVKFQAVLGLQEPFALVAAVAFLPSHGASHPEDELQALHERFRATVRYKTKALAGPLVAGHALLLLPLRDEASAAEALGLLRAVLARTHADDFEKDHLRMGFGGVKPLGEAKDSWSQALAELLGSRAVRKGAGFEERPFEEDDKFLEGLLNGSHERARMNLERLLEPLKELPLVPSSERYRIIALFGSACRMLTRKGLLEGEEAAVMMDLEDLGSAESGPVFALAALARFARLVALVGRVNQWSPLVSRTIAYLRENFGNQISLESTAYALGISPNRLSRLFSEETGKGFSDYLIEFRIEKAKELLMVPGASIKHVSISCGYPDPNYFSRLFKKVTGLTPTSFSVGAPEASDGKS